MQMYGLGSETLSPGSVAGGLGFGWLGRQESLATVRGSCDCKREVVQLENSKYRQ